MTSRSAMALNTASAQNGRTTRVSNFISAPGRARRRFQCYDIKTGLTIGTVRGIDDEILLKLARCGGRPRVTASGRVHGPGGMLRPADVEGRGGSCRQKS